MEEGNRYARRKIDSGCIVEHGRVIRVTDIRCTEVPVVPVDFTSEYPTCCALLGLFDILTAERITFKEDTKRIRKLIKKISHNRCFDPEIWKYFNFFALVEPDDDILPVRTLYDGVTQNIGNNFLTSKTPLWFAGCDVVASAIRTGKVPRILRAIRIVPQGKQKGMKTVSLRGSMVEIDPYKDDLFRKVIEQRKLNEKDEKLYYWLKILANSIYGFFVELIPELQNANVKLDVFSGEKNFSDSSDVIEKEGKWFFAPLGSLNYFCRTFIAGNDGGLRFGEKGRGKHTMRENPDGLQNEGMSNSEQSSVFVGITLGTEKRLQGR